MVSERADFGAHLSRMARRRPGDPALICPRPYGNPAAAPCFSYEQLEEESEVLARGLLELGIGPGVRAVFLVQPGFAFFGLAFGLLKAGGVLVGVDPLMGRANLAQCLREAEPRGFLGVPAAHVFRRMLGWGKGSIAVNVTTARRSSLRGGRIGLSALRALGRTSNRSLPVLSPEDPAIIAFTSGSTGVPKGAVYSHGLLNAQLAAMRDCFGIEEGERDLVTFPHFALFGPGLGATLVLANMDFTRPGRALPSWIVRSLREYRITTMFGSPALLDRVGRYGAQRGVKLPALRRVVSAGAPVPARVIEQVSGMMDGGAFYTPYGATEALPVTCIRGAEILSQTRARTADGRGVCVGKPVGDVEVRIIRITDDPIEAWSDELEVPAGEVGEIAVSGPVVSRSYFNRPGQTALAKIPRGEDFFHRMGDLGYMDAEGRFWFCGRKSQRIPTPGGAYYTVPAEGVFNAHPLVRRSALVGVRDEAGYPRPVLCVELHRRVPARAWPAVRAELLAWAAQRPGTAMIREVLRHPRFPVDRRHNAKIAREKLAVWAGRRMR